MVIFGGKTMDKSSIFTTEWSWDESNNSYPQDFRLADRKPEIFNNPWFI